MAATPNAELTRYFAKTTYETKPDQTVATADVYTSNGQTVINDAQTKTKGMDPATADIMRGGKSLLNAIPVALAVAKDGSLLSSKGGFAQQILGGSSFISRTLGRINGNKELGSLMTKITGNSNLSLGDVYAKTDRLVRRVAASDLKNIRSISSIMNEATGKKGLFEIQDKDSDVATYAGIISESTRYGMPTSFGDIANIVNSSTTLNRIMAGALPDVVANSDSATLKDMAGSSIGGMNLLNPNVTMQFSENYSAPPQCTAAQAQSEYGNVMDAFKATSPTWDQRSVGGTNVTDLTKLAGASDDMKGIVKAGTTSSSSLAEKMYNLADKYFGRSTAKDLSNKFPETYVPPAGSSDYYRWLGENTTIK